MKKFLVLIASIVFVAVTCCSLVGCTFVKETVKEEEESKQSYTVLDDGTVLIDSLENSSEIGFVSVDRDENDKPYSGVQEVLEKTKVNRAVVAIRVMLESNTYTGSGIIVDIDDGIDGNDNEFYIVTCHHVIEHCEEYPQNTVAVNITDDNGKTYNDSGYNTAFQLTGNITNTINANADVKLIGGDKNSDVALLKIKAPNSIKDKIVKAKVMGSSYKLALGEAVFAVGNAQGEHPGRVSEGIVADTSYETDWDDIGPMTLIDITANIYPGNSGGGLFNMYGELVGITNGGEVVSVGTTTVPTGINYSIPHKISDNLEKDNGFINIMAQLLSTYKKSGGKNYGYVTGHHPLFGFTITLGTDTLGGEYVYVSVVNADGIAANQGLKANDVIKSIAVNGAKTTITSFSVASGILSSLKIGDKAILEVERTETVKGKYPQTTTVNTYEIELNVLQYYFLNTGVYDGISVPVE